MALKSLENEAALLANVARGDHRAFCTLFDHYSPYVYGFGRKLTRSDDQAEEIVQDIFIKIWTGREQLPDLVNFEAYLTRLVRNQAYTVLRKKMRHTRIHADLADALENTENNLEHQLDYRESRRLLDEATALLTKQQQRVYALCHQQGMKYEDAAGELGISTDTVHFHMKAALKIIRNYFKQHGFGYVGLFFFLFS